MDLISLPKLCTLTFTKSPDDKDDAPPIPTLTTRFENLADPGDEPPLELFEVITGAKIEITPTTDRIGYRTIVFTVVHDCPEDECPHLWSRVLFDYPEEAIRALELSLNTMKSFLWVCSTSEYFGKAVVSQKSHLIVTKTVEYRLIH